MMNAAEVRGGVRDMSQRHPGGMTMTGSPRTAPTVLSMLASARRGLAEAADETVAKRPLRHRPSSGAARRGGRGCGPRRASATAQEAA